MILPLMLAAFSLFPSPSSGEKYLMADILKTPNMGVADFHKLNYTAKKQYNVRGLDLQLESVIPALGLSLLFNRSYIMPKLACYCDRFWTPLDDCRVPGARQQRLPFQCPMDYVLDPIGLIDDASSLKVGVWVRELKLDLDSWQVLELPHSFTHSHSPCSILAGPTQVKWRESSFLDNPRCLDKVKRSRLTIYTSKVRRRPYQCLFSSPGQCPVTPAAVTPQKYKVPTEKYIVQDGGPALLLPASLTTKELQAALKPYEQYKVLNLVSVASKVVVSVGECLSLSHV